MARFFWSSGPFRPAPEKYGSLFWKSNLIKKWPAFLKELAILKSGLFCPLFHKKRAIFFRSGTKWPALSKKAGHFFLFQKKKKKKAIFCSGAGQNGHSFNNKKRRPFVRCFKKGPYCPGAGQNGTLFQQRTKWPAILKQRTKRNQ